MQTNFRNNTSTRIRGKQWTYSALIIFELCICEYDHLNNIRCSISQKKFTQYITKNIVASTHCAFEGWRLFKVMKPSMWYLDDNRWDAGQQQILTKCTFPFFSVDSTARFACWGPPM